MRSSNNNNPLFKIVCRASDAADFKGAFLSILARLQVKLFRVEVTDRFSPLRLVGPNDDEDQQEKTLSQVYDQLPEGFSPLGILKNKDERERIGKLITAVGINLMGLH